MNIGLKTVQEQPPTIQRGGEIQDETMQINAPRGGKPNNNPEIATPEALDEQFDYQGTSRKQYENAMYNKVCSEILDQFLYLGSDIVAKDYEKLKENGITHVINCAADYSDNYH